MEPALHNIFEQCRTRLLQAIAQPGHAYYTGVIASHEAGDINLRTVVLRDFDADELDICFYTDKRAAKIANISVNNNVSWLFYDAGERVQLRLKGEADFHANNVMARRHWDKISPYGRNLYRANAAPGTKIKQPAYGLEYLADCIPDGDLGFENFAVVVTKINYLEWLWLRAGGHRRASFSLSEDGEWLGAWLMP